MPNRLAQETSPYLRQHADNPVDWYPWGDEALQRAQAEDKPILLSIGYAACHWCHVMAHESFENMETAVTMNTHFINIKVDREERPDLDSIYMNAVVAMTGQGGWPMTVFLTPDGKPFFGGTYFPPTPRYNMPSFPQLLASINRAWHEQRADIDENAVQLTQGLARVITQGDQDDPLDETLFESAIAGLTRTFDEDRGGFGNAPKFPPSMTLEFLLRTGSRLDDADAGHMVEHTLKMMATGGMYDQLGGGFARYATDRNWLVPHFEKMLYDNALLARVYLHAYQITGDLFYRRVAVETLDFLLREMRHEAGGFYSSYDADSEGEEGKFYVWQPAEIREILREDAEPFMLYYDVTERGNWEGKSILNVPRAPEEVAELLNMEVDELKTRLAASQQKLYAVRSQRVWPGLDDKVLTAWNGLALAAFAEAARILPRPDYIQAAQQNAEFLYENLRLENGRLLRTWKAGAKAKYNAYLEDYAYLADGLLALYQTTFNEKWFAWAQELGDMMLDHFKDPDG
ncbi:MAG: thioredoxin domain-containing protein, partial [Anaerolineae bacterium]|nr:thioredoxin domain-containing protein [Anaerolineae bacterium]